MKLPLLSLTMRLAKASLGLCLLSVLGSSAKLLPVTVKDPVYSTSTAVRVLNTQLGRRITVLRNGNAVASAGCNTGDGETKVAISGGLGDGDLLTATQDDGQGDVSEEGIAVTVAPPPPLGVPEIASSLTACSAKVYLAGLTPGAEISFIYGGQQAGAPVIVREPAQVFDLPKQPVLGSTVVFRQDLGGNSEQIESEVISNPPILPNVRYPEFRELICGQLSVDIYTAVPSVQSLMENGGKSNRFLNLAQQYTQPLLFPLQRDTLLWNQTYSCKAPPVVTMHTIGPPRVLVPVIETAGCQKTPRLTVTNVLPGASVTLYGDGQVLGESTAASEPFLDLPLKAVEGLGVTPTLTVQQTVCGVTQTSAPVRFDQQEAPIRSTPAISMFYVYACAKAVYVNVRLVPANYVRRLRIIDASTGEPASSIVQLTGSSTWIQVGLLQPAVADQKLQAILDTCSATYASPVVVVQSFLKLAPQLLPVAPRQPYIYVNGLPAGIPLTIFANDIQLTTPGPGRYSIDEGDGLTEIKLGKMYDVGPDGDSYNGYPAYSSIPPDGDVTVVIRGCGKYSKAVQGSTQNIARQNLLVKYSPTSANVGEVFIFTISATDNPARIPTYSPIYKRVGIYSLDSQKPLYLDSSIYVRINSINGGVGTVLETPDSLEVPFQIRVSAPPPPPPPPPTFSVEVIVLNLQYGLINFYGKDRILWHLIISPEPYGIVPGFGVQASVNGKDSPVATNVVRASFSFPRPNNQDVILAGFAGQVFDFTDTVPLAGATQPIYYTGQPTVFICIALNCNKLPCTAFAYQGAGGCPQNAEAPLPGNYSI